MTIKVYDVSVECGAYCLGGRPSCEETAWPDDYSIVKYPDHLAALRREREVREKLEQRVTTLEELIATYLPVCIGDCGCEGANLGCDVLDEEEDDAAIVEEICARAALGIDKEKSE